MGLWDVQGRYVCQNAMEGATGSLRRTRATVAYSERSRNGHRQDDLPPWNVSISKVRIWNTSKGDSLSGKRYTAEQIIGHLRQAEIRTSEGKTIAEAVRELGISEQTYYRWRKQYGGMEVNQARRLKELEQENGRLKRLVADQALDLSIHKEVSRGNF